MLLIRYCLPDTSTLLSSSCRQRIIGISNGGQHRQEIKISYEPALACFREGRSGTISVCISRILPSPEKRIRMHYILDFLRLGLKQPHRRWKEMVLGLVKLMNHRRLCFLSMTFEKLKLLACGPSVEVLSEAHDHQELKALRIFSSTSPPPHR